VSEQLSEHFEKHELECHGEDCCGHSAPVSPLLLDFLEEFRDEVSQPVMLSCAFRCGTHNTAIGSDSETSQHPRGTAADILLLEGGWTVDHMGEVAEKVLDNNSIFADIHGGIGLYEWGIHVDVRHVYEEVTAETVATVAEDRGNSADEGTIARWDDRDA
jgi:hypothetical protein